ncbi:YdaS family helix-turn-helix protein [Sphingomonas sp. NFR15]|uniref:transcriptional regulator n=1 Tax=Sphingomonas sp. NFR15 TaxID=1566282 RepID=UPI000B861053|nr:YdaS family helix-turn-helix protein [Sphingomonas sp. NFR15]
MEQEPTPFEALTQAVEIAGGQSALGRICGKAQPTVWKWLQNGKHLPPEHVLAVEDATGVSRYLLRPDIYPRDHTADLSPTPLGVACDRAPILDRGAGG